LLIDGLSAWNVGSVGGSHHDKRCTHYNRNLDHGSSP